MKKSLLVFGKAQAASLSGGLADFLVMVLLTELAGLHYTAGIAAGGITGALLNFTLNKRWTFQSENPYQSSPKEQLLKFLLVVLGSILLKAGGTYQVTLLLSTDYKLSRIFTELIISYAFNFPLMKYWVFKKLKGSSPERLLFV